MASNGVLLRLTDTIQTETAKVDEFIKASGLPEPSFDSSCPPVLQLSPEAELARNAALEALDELRAHLLGPLGMIMGTLGELSQFVSVHGLTQFNIAAALPADGSPITFEELTSKTGMHIDDAKTIVRHASSRRLIRHSADDCISHAAASKAIVSVPALASVTSGAALITKSLSHVVDVMGQWPGSQDLHRAPYSLAHQTNLSFFDHLATQPESAKQFAESMGFLMNNPALRSDFIFAYDWSLHANGTVVDVGGSHGNIAFPLAEKFPQMKVIVQDRPEIVATAPVNRHPNVTFEIHDFFTTQPNHGADAYFLRYILHDWPETYCLNILRGLIPALKPGARIVMMDAIVPEPGMLGKLDERRITESDLIMKALFNAKERSEGEWRALIRQADPGKFRVVECIQPKGSQLGFVVVEWMG